jgi:hypothetical protein
MPSSQPHTPLLSDAKGTTSSSSGFFKKPEMSLDEIKQAMLARAEILSKRAEVEAALLKNDTNAIRTIANATCTKYFSTVKSLKGVSFSPNGCSAQTGAALLFGGVGTVGLTIAAILTGGLALPISAAVLGALELGGGYAVTATPGYNAATRLAQLADLYDRAIAPPAPTAAAATSTAPRP